MSTLLDHDSGHSAESPSRHRPLARVVLTVAALVLAALGVQAAPAQAAPTGTATGGTFTWGLSTYLNSSNMGRPNPKADAYIAPATFDAGGRLSSWGTGTGAVTADGSAALAFSGTSVNFAATSGAWLRLADPQVSVDADGNGTMSALVSYGLAPGVYPGIVYDANEAPQRGPVRVNVMTLAGNTAADRILTPTTATWTGLDGTWSTDFTTFLGGDTEPDPDVPGFAYAGQVNATADRTPLPLTFEVSTVAPAVTTKITVIDPTSGLTIKATGTGFRGVGNVGDAGIYAGIAEAGGLPDVSSPSGMAAFAGVQYVPAAAIVDGGFTSSINAATDKLDPAKSYTLYTWQAHTHSNTTQDTATPLTFNVSQLQSTPAVSPEVTSQTNAGGVAVTLNGSNFVAATNPGDSGVYVGIAEAGGLPDVSSQEGQGAFLDSDWVMPAQILAGAFTKNLTIATADLDPTASYAVYTWQAHTHSNVSQDTETALPIDFSALVKAPAVTVAGPSSVKYGAGAALTATVPDATTGTVQVRRNGAVVTSIGLSPVGTATYTVPRSWVVGSNVVTFHYSGNEAAFLGAAVGTKNLTITKAPVTESLRVPVRPTPTKRGQAIIRVLPTVAGAPAVTGQVQIQLIRGGVVRFTLAPRTLTAGAATIGLQKLGRGTWTVRARYLGSGNNLPTVKTVTFTVR